jgi:transposase
MKKSVPPLSDADESALKRLWRQGKNHRERQRAQAVLLSSRGYSLDQLSDILGADRDTISRWLNAWQELAVAGLADAPRSGRPSKLDTQVEQALREILEQPSANLKAVIAAELEKRGCK